MEESKVRSFFRRLDRSLFLDDAYKPLAHVDKPLPIGHAQTISQPSLVVKMTALLSPDRESRVLEIGTGSGYQTAFLAEFANEVFTVERIGALSEKAAQRLRALGYENIRYRVGDGSGGWPEHAPYDRIMVTAAAGRFPRQLAAQLAANGRMVVPVGPVGMQELLLITKDADGNVRSEPMMYVTFVEMKGEYGWREGP